MKRDELLDLECKIWASSFVISLILFLEKEINWNIDWLMNNKQFMELLKYDVDLCRKFKILKEKNENWKKWN